MSVCPFVALIIIIVNRWQANMCNFLVKNVKLTWHVASGCNKKWSFWLLHRKLSRRDLTLFTQRHLTFLTQRHLTLPTKRDPTRLTQRHPMPTLLLTRRDPPKLLTPMSASTAVALTTALPRDISHFSPTELPTPLLTPMSASTAVALTTARPSGYSSSMVVT